MSKSQAIECPNCLNQSSNFYCHLYWKIDYVTGIDDEGKLEFEDFDTVVADEILTIENTPNNRRDGGHFLCGKCNWAWYDAKLL